MQTPLQEETGGVGPLLRHPDKTTHRQKQLFSCITCLARICLIVPVSNQLIANGHLRRTASLQCSNTSFVTTYNWFSVFLNQFQAELMVSLQMPHGRTVPSSTPQGLRVNSKALLLIGGVNRIIYNHLHVIRITVQLSSEFDL